ncbi:MAG: tRNA lysidine(34) synthetase TilS [Peptostreptococcus sp.]|uniref:tRNA lysidine(34) synthetase TilS n=1 Tax=Peptostreptococcus sp. TaxID=1262 RepID=UPI002FC95356
MLYEDVLETVKKNNLINENDKIVVALSGGPDSVCLLHVLHRMSKEMNLKVYAAHLNHQIRGLDAYVDSLYVMRICESLEVPCFIRAIDVPKFCDENKMGLEDGARMLRYDIFEEIRERVGADKIAIGHNQNDQAETVLMRVMRGTGLQGLRGIEYKRDENIIRPILDISREEIEKYCEEYELSPRIDATNLEAIYSRNKIRLKLLPYMKEEFNENIIESIVRMSNNIKVDSDYIDSQVKIAYEEAAKSYEDGVYIFTDILKNMHKAIQSRIVIEAIKKVMGNAKSIDKKHINDVLKLISDTKKSKKINLPKGLFAYRFNDYIMITKKKINFENIEFSYNLELGKDIYIDEIAKTFKSKVIEASEFDIDSMEEGCQYIDFGKIKGNLTLRNKRQGDKIRLQGGTKKIKELFIGMKIPREDRSLVPLIVDEGIVISVCGYRINADYKINDDTEKILKFTLE